MSTHDALFSEWKESDIPLDHEAQYQALPSAGEVEYTQHAEYMSESEDEEEEENDPFWCTVEMGYSRKDPYALSPMTEDVLHTLGTKRVLIVQHRSPEQWRYYPDRVYSSSRIPEKHDEDMERARTLQNAYVDQSIQSRQSVSTGDVLCAKILEGLSKGASVLYMEGTPYIYEQERLSKQVFEESRESVLAQTIADAKHEDAICQKTIDLQTSQEMEYDNLYEAQRKEYISKKEELSQEDWKAWKSVFRKRKDETFMKLQRHFKEKWDSLKAEKDEIAANKRRIVEAIQQSPIPYGFPEAITSEKIVKISHFEPIDSIPQWHKIVQHAGQMSEEDVSPTHTMVGEWTRDKIQMGDGLLVIRRGQRHFFDPQQNIFFVDMLYNTMIPMIVQTYGIHSIDASRILPMERIFLPKCIFAEEPELFYILQSPAPFATASVFYKWAINELTYAEKVYNRAHPDSKGVISYLYIDLQSNTGIPNVSMKTCVIPVPTDGGL